MRSLSTILLIWLVINLGLISNAPWPIATHMWAKPAVLSSDIVWVSFSADSKCVLALADSRISVLDIDSRSFIARFGDKVSAADLPRTRNFIVTADEVGTVKIWDYRTGTELTSSPLLPSPPITVAVSADGRTVAWVNKTDEENSSSKIVIAAILSSNKGMSIDFDNAKVANLPKGVRHLAFSPSSDRLVATTEEDRLQVIDVSDGKTVTHTNLSTPSIPKMPLSRFRPLFLDEGHLLIGSIIISTDTWDIESRLPGPADRSGAWHGAVCRSEQVFVAVGGGRLFRLNWKTRQPSSSIIANWSGGAVRGLDISPDGQFLVTAGELFHRGVVHGPQDPNIHLWRAESENHE